MITGSVYIDFKRYNYFIDDNKEIIVNNINSGYKLNQDGSVISKHGSIYKELDRSTWARIIKLEDKDEIELEELV